MKKIPIYQIDAFTDTLFGGNPAAVCPLESWLEEKIMQQLAAENNLSETAFFVPATDGTFDIRWFTPKSEIDLCGHATLASGHLILNILDSEKDVVLFNYGGGQLKVAKKNEILEMDFPAIHIAPTEIDASIEEAIGAKAVEMYQGRDIMVVLKNESEVKNLHPNFSLLADRAKHGVIVTAPGEKHDFVSRFFAPGIGINEDPVTGSAHCVLTPYWADRLNKVELIAKQLSEREGIIYCQRSGDRIMLSGKAILYMQGVAFLQ